MLTTVISVVDYIPTHDGPNTIVHGYLALHLHDPGKGYDRFLDEFVAAAGMDRDRDTAALIELMTIRRRWTPSDLGGNPADVLAAIATKS